MSLFFFFFFFIFILSPSPSLQQQQKPQYMSSFSSSDSAWRPNQNRILLSPNSTFAAGFLPKPNSRNLFTFSVWYYNLSEPTTTVIWSANDKFPVAGNGSLVIAATTGQLRLLNSSNSNLWPNPKTATGHPNSTRLFLQDAGNLVYGNWQSFNLPTDTILPNQTLNGPPLVSKNGKFSFLNASELVFVSANHSYWKSEHAFQQLDYSGKLLQANQDSLTASDLGETRLRRLTIDDDGNLRIYSYDDNGDRWTVVWQAVQEICTIPDLCGENAICISDGLSRSTSCVCPPGFKNSTRQDKSCQRKIELKNLRNTKFLQLDYVNFSRGNLSDLEADNFSACKANCSANPKCVAFGFKYDGKRYCVLVDQLLYGYWSPGTEMATFLRVDESENDVSNFTGMTNLLVTTCPVNISLPLPPDESSTTARNIAIIVTLFAAELISGAWFFWAFLKKYIKYRDMARTLGLELLPAGGPKRFTHAELRAATNGFSNLIGRGGFGDVYKGELTDHRVVAVKCLKNVTGGDAEFWAEVTIIARMHHLNLVRLWGFCAEKGERTLVYEYVPNGSLADYLFRSGRVGSSSPARDMEMSGVGPHDGGKPVLDWSIRYRIALGVARAIAYLHEECLEWVLHCDIKPENILLGDDFCPKISDFGLAKLRKKEDMVSMSRIRGTRGYMAPEWLRSDQITPKADVYSFGMVLLEIVSGSRNFEIQGSVMNSDEWYFPKWAFEKVYEEMKVEDILDRHIKNSYDSRVHFDMVNRMVKTAMWCIQDRPEMRPSMGKAAKMLEGTVEITEPKKPTIYFLGDVAMGLRSSGRKLSFDILSEAASVEDAADSRLFRRSNSLPTHRHTEVSMPKNRKRKKHKKKKQSSPDFAVISEDPVSDSNAESAASGVVFGNRSDANCQSYVASVCASSTITVAAAENGYNNIINNGGELRQRNVAGNDEAESREEEISVEKQQQRSSEANGSVVTKLETAESLDWKRLMAEDPNYMYPVETSPLKYFMEEMYTGNSLQSTTTLGDEKERQRVYDTIFRLPWRCELLIDVGFFVCFDSFLSLLTIMPTRILLTLWRLLHTRQFIRPSAAELCDFACFLVLACAVTLLEGTDISLIYHMIRGQGTIKLYVVYNVLEIFDKLCQSFGGDVLQTLFNSAEGLANCTEENMRFWIWRFISDQALAMAATIVHSFILLAQAITLSTCIVAHNNALLALLVSNNFAEIKSNVFKRFSKDNIHSLVYADSIERFHISAFLLFVLAQNILEAEGPWFESFLFNALLVFVCEMLIDIIKHSFLAKFNDIKPIAYSEFLEDLCKQTLNMQTENGKKNLTFVPLAPACVVIRVLTPVFAARLPCTPLPWRLFWILLLSAMTYVMLASLKVMIGMGLQRHATWYVKRCQKRKHHLHFD